MRTKFSKRVWGGWLAVVLVLSMIGAAAATPGSLDLTFDTDGKVTTHFGFGGQVFMKSHGMDNGKALALAGNQYLMAGNAYVDIPGGVDPRFGLTRFNQDGSVDTSFGVDGAATPDFQWDDYAEDMTLQPDGKIIVVGYSGYYDLHDPADLTVARFLPDGDLDTSFSEDGWVTTNINGGIDAAYGVAVSTTTGQIVVAGVAETSSGVSDLLAVAYTPTGTLDTSFGGGDGIVTYHINDGVWEEAKDVAFDNNGRIVIGGYTDDGGKNPTAVRLLANGTPDTTFGSNGYIALGLAGPSEAFALAIQADNKIVLAGYIEEFDADAGATIRHYCLARILADGSQPDSSFGNNGIVTTSFSGYEGEIYDLVIEADGHIVTAGRIDEYGNKRILLSRYSASGELLGSSSATPLPSDAGYTTGLALQADGKFAVGGYWNGVLLTRYNSDLSLDTLFGSTVPNTFGSAGAYSIALQPDGKIVAGGDLGNTVDDYKFALARYLKDGSLDSSFGTGGKVITNFGSAYPSHWIEEVAIQQDGKILAVGGGEDDSWNESILMARYTSTGALDTSFDTDGLVEYQCAMDCRASAAKLQADGKILVAGNLKTSTPGSNANLLLARFNQNGSLDSSFGTGGKVEVDFGVRSFARDIALLQDGDILAAGSVSIYSATYDEYIDSIALVRFNSNGTLDTSFGTDGKAVFNFGDSNVARDLAIQPDGKIVVGGLYEIPYISESKSRAKEDYYDMFVVRIQPDGKSVDTGFGTAGLVRISFGNHDWEGSMALQLNGKIVIGGYSDAGGDSEDMCLARLNPDGSLDAAFGSDGKLIINVLLWDRLYDLQIQPDGKILAAGWSQYGNSLIDFALARIEGDPVQTLYLPVVTR